MLDIDAGSYFHNFLVDASVDAFFYEFDYTSIF